MTSIILSLLEFTFGKVTEVVYEEIKKIVDADKNLKNLESTASNVRNLFDRVKIFNLDDITQVELLTQLEELIKICYDVEDTIHDITYEIENRNLGSSKKPVRRSIMKCFKHVCKPHHFVTLQEKLSIKLEEVNLLLNNSTQSEPPLSLSISEQKFSAEDFVGRKVEIDDIVHKLISNDVAWRGVSILGMDGLGKTQLALAILEDTRISKQYNCVKFNCVKLQVGKLNGSFDLKEATKLLEEQFDKNGFINEQIQNTLIVIDNLLDINDIHWDEFWGDIQKIMHKMSINIRFLITTHNPEVSKTMKTFPYYLKPLSDQNCNTLIVKKALSHSPELSGGDLSNFTDTLAKKCGGLPIVARLLGVILAKLSPDERKRMLNGDLWCRPEFRKEILPILRSGYLNMHPQLEQCVAYFSLFSDGYHFNTHKLIHQWAGVGFLQKRQGTSTFLDNEYFSCLRGRSILQDCNDTNNNEWYKLHKFTRKFSQLAATKTFVRFEKGMKTLNECSEYARHLSLLCDTMDNPTWDEVQKLKRLRTFLALHCKIIGPIPDDFFKTLTRLRVLDLNDTNISELSDYICKLKFLRFLDISFTLLKKLPIQLSKLSLLEFLHLHNTPLNSLPPQFCNLTNLVALDWEMTDIRRLQPAHIGNLSKLQTLPLFIVDDKDGYRIRELKHMNDLRESLCITNLEKVKNKAEAEEAMLDKKKDLKRIDLQWMISSNEGLAEGLAKEVLKGLKPHCCLNELNIINYSGINFPRWIFDPSQMFEKMHLESCQKCTFLPALGGLRDLKNLIIEGFSELQLIDREFCGPSSPSGVGRFPELEYLSFKDLPQLREWKELEANNDFPRLRILKVEDCSQLNSLPSLKNLTSLVELQIERCPTMASLPELPTSIESLKIRNSNLLKERCVRGGADWQKVDLVPKVEIDYEIIQTSRTSTHKPSGQDQKTKWFQGCRIGLNSAGKLLSGLRLWNAQRSGRKSIESRFGTWV